MRGKIQKWHGARSGEYGGSGKTVTCYLASSSCIMTEQCAGSLSCSNSQIFQRQSSGRLRRIESLKRTTKDLLVAGFVYRCTFWDDFHVNSSIKKSTNITFPFVLSCRGFIRRGNTGVIQRASCRFSCGSYRKHHVSSPGIFRLRNVGSPSALLIRSPQIYLRSSCWCRVRMRGTLCWITRDMFSRLEMFVQETQTSAYGSCNHVIQ